MARTKTAVEDEIVADLPSRPDAITLEAGDNEALLTVDAAEFVLSREQIGDLRRQADSVYTSLN